MAKIPFLQNPAGWPRDFAELSSGCSAAGSVLGSGPRGRAFESPHSDQSSAGSDFSDPALFFCFNEKRKFLKMDKPTDIRTNCVFDS